MAVIEAVQGVIGGAGEISVIEAVVTEAAETMATVIVIVSIIEAAVTEAVGTVKIATAQAHHHSGSCRSGN